MQRILAPLERLWRDPDRRRAAMLSVVAHLCVLLLFVLWVSRPRPVPLEQFIVIDVGSPVQEEVRVDAPTVDEAAPPTPTPQVADEETGEPQARTAEVPETTAPEPEPVTAQPEPQPQAEARPEPEETPTRVEQPARSEPETLAEPQEETPEPEPEQANEPAPQAPLPQVRAPEPAPAVPDLPDAATATVLPEVDEVELEPRPAEQAIRIPQPAAAATVPEARTLAVTPSATVTPRQEVPLPAVAAEVATAEDVPRPQATASVAQARAVPQPNARAAVAEAQAVPTPGARAEVTAATAIPQPRVDARVEAARAVPQPAATVAVARAQAIPSPSVTAQVPQARQLDVAPRVAVSNPVPVPTPSIRAQAEAPQAELGAQMIGAAPEGAAQTPSNRQEDLPAGGNAQRTGQNRADEAALAGNLGRAADTEPGAGDGADSLRPRVPYREERERPLAVLLDNAAGYPQAGLPEASLIAEMPVEGGLTRLMALYDRVDPAQVGPVRSARDYFVELARDYDGILVHDGGSPAALAAIDRGGVPTLNAYRFGELFSRQQGRSAPYNLYSSGGSLREAVHNLRLDRLEEIRGVVPRPPLDAPDGDSVEVVFGGNYRSGFSYLRELDIYRWRRNGENAVDHRGEAVFVEAVMVARIDARPIPDDPAGRLYIPLRGGGATLYLQGKVIQGNWLPAQDEGQGVVFVLENGEPMDLTPFRMWILFAPGYAQVTGG